MQICEQHFSVQPAVCENHCLQSALQEFLREPRSFVDAAAANSEIAIDHRRIVKNKKFFAGGRAVCIHHFHFFFQKIGGEFARIRDRGAAANELRLRSIECRHAVQPTQHVAQMAAEDSAIGVEFIEHHILQIFEQPLPLGVMRKNSSVQHVWIAEDDVPFFADRFACVRGSVAIVSKNSEGVIETLPQIVKLGELILRQRFRRKKIQRPRIRICETAFITGKL